MYDEHFHRVGDVVYIINEANYIIQTSIKAIIIPANSHALFVVDYDPSIRFRTVYPNLEMARNMAIENLTEG